MKTDIHPTNNRQVIFVDDASGQQFLVYSTIETTEKGTFEGKEYDLSHVEISSASHPFYTGKDIRLDTAGRAEKFNKKKAAAAAAKQKKVRVKKEKDEKTTDQ